MSIVSAMKSKDFFVSFSSPSEQDIKDSEEKLGLRFSHDYYEYVSAFGAASFEGHELTGVCKPERLNVVNVTMEERNYAEVPNDFYVVEQTNIDGIVIWQNTAGDIFATAPGQSPKKLHNSLEEYINT